MDFCKKCCNWYCCAQQACGVAQCIDGWHAIEACGLSYLFCQACCWTLCAPLCIDCTLGDGGKAMENCTKGIKYCIFACALDCVAGFDGCYNCWMITNQVCFENKLVTTFADLTKNAEFFGNKVKEALGIETGNEPLKSMGTFQPWLVS